MIKEISRVIVDEYRLRHFHIGVTRINYQKDRLTGTSIRVTKTSRIIILKPKARVSWKIITLIFLLFFFIGALAILIIIIAQMRSIKFGRQIVSSIRDIGMHSKELQEIQKAHIPEIKFKYCPKCLYQTPVTSTEEICPKCRRKLKDPE